MNNILAVLYREFKIRSTSMVWLFYDLAVPLIYLLLFGVAFNGAVGSGSTAVGGASSYHAFFLPGVLAMACFGVAINTAYGFFMDRDSGIFYEHLTYPMSRAQFLFGRILFNCLMALGQTVITTGIAVLGLGVRLPVERLAMLALGIVGGTAGWFFFLTVFAIRIRRNDIFGTFLNAVYYILMFASTIFYPVEIMPSWLKTLVIANPLTWHTDILRWSTGGNVAGNIWMESFAFLGFLLVFFLLAVRTIDRRIIE
jgi:ABC-type polysaccharide/polyol phosphate export permease